MTRTDGEHELVLGNKQLLSAFFVVVTLLGVFFAMGYFVGKNTATAGFNSGQTVASGGPRPDASGKAIDSGQDPSGGAPGGTPDSTSPGGDSGGPAPARPSGPAATAATPEPSSEAGAAAKTERPAPARPEVTPAADPTPTHETPASETIVETGGEQKYLQVSALRRSDADNMVKLLRDHHFPALLGESSKPGLVRVLVGPFKTNTDMAHAKAALKAKGFDSIVAK